MTEWIDEIVKEQDQKERTENDDRRIQLLHAGLIASRLPAFFKDLVTEVKLIAAEMDAKLGASLGGIVTSGNLTVASGQTSKGYKATLEITLDAPGHRIVATRRITGGGYLGDGESEPFDAGINSAEVLFVKSRTGVYYNPSEIANHVMRWTFADLLALKS